MTKEEAIKIAVGAFDPQGLPPCTNCKHFQKMGSPESEGFDGWICKAFPEGIPPTILDRMSLHDTVLMYQEGNYTFEPEKREVRKGVFIWEDWDFNIHIEENGKEINYE